MKNLFTLIVFVLLAGSLLSFRHAVAQAPDKMSYQAVIRDTEGNLVAGETVGMKISILHGTVDGTVVYTETRRPETNSNGLVTFEIGGEGATAVTGIFAAIDWSAGPWFIRTETDPSGGTDYTEKGTSQLLSVPYAFHAKTAETISEPIVESDPLFDASPAAGIEAADIDNWDEAYLWGDHAEEGYLTEETDPYYRFSEAFNITDAGSGAVITDDERSKLAGYEVGDFAHGGVVFYVEPCGTKGLVAAKEDQSAGVRWYAGTSGNTQAKGDGPYAGKANTAIIIAAQVAIGDDNNTYAARICNELEIIEGGKTYGDWYLPSKEELNLMYINKAIIDATAWVNEGYPFVDSLYWSSTEFDNIHTWCQSFTNGNQSVSFNYETLRVRAVRAF